MPLQAAMPARVTARAANRRALSGCARLWPIGWGRLGAAGPMSELFALPLAPPICPPTGCVRRVGRAGRLVVLKREVASQRLCAFAQNGAASASGDRLLHGSRIAENLFDQTRVGYGCLASASCPVLSVEFTSLRFFWISSLSSCTSFPGQGAFVLHFGDRFTF